MPRKTSKGVSKRSQPRGRRPVYFFGDGRADGRADQRALLGGKGANLAEMVRIGVPVPPGFTITTEVCKAVSAAKGEFPAGLDAAVEKNLAKVERLTDRRFGSTKRPLLLSVRSGARASMPGMMDTVLNLGLNRATLEGLAEESNSPRFAYDCYRRLLAMFGDVVLGLGPEDGGELSPFEQILGDMKTARGVALDTELDEGDLAKLCKSYEDLIARRSGRPFPQDPVEQLWMAVGAVFRSWDGARAISYRKMQGIPHDWGTAANVQAMVFGNLGDDCATGVLFTRDPRTGEKGLYGEFLVNAQGEDVVAGIRTPQPITLAASRRHAESHGLTEAGRRSDALSLEEAMPRCYRELRAIARRLEKHYGDMQDIEFTIERGRLLILQTRTGKRTVAAAVKIAVDLVKEKVIDREAAVLRVQPPDLLQMLHPQIDRSTPLKAIAKGLPASPGAVSGEVVFDAPTAVANAEAGQKTILVRVETSPEDIDGIHSSQGILTARGGMTSHAAVVARGMGKCCVVGCGDLEIDYERQQMKLGGRKISRGEVVTLDGSTGEIFLGRVPTTRRELGKDFGTFMRWADGFRRLGVRANAETPHDAAVARHFGAEGIGLCRTEHMFFEGDRIDIVREMILAPDQDGRDRALAKLLPIQKGDFLAILRSMAGLPVTIRLLDPPLHEFLPNTDKEIKAVSVGMGVSARHIRQLVEAMREANPMLGHRGCRLGISFPEIYAMQTRAVVEAAIELRREGVRVAPEIMIPLVSHEKELEILRNVVEKAATDAAKRYGRKYSIPVGTMIELPCAALTADEIAQHADFFSLGTNDLTQTALGLSRDDAARFLFPYVTRGIYQHDPFVSIDRKRVGELVRTAVDRGRSVKPELSIGLCGEHGGDPDSIHFCNEVGLDYVSCSPFRVPIARLAAAHAALREDDRKTRKRKAR